MAIFSLVNNIDDKSFILLDIYYEHKINAILYHAIGNIPSQLKNSSMLHLGEFRFKLQSPPLTPIHTRLTSNIIIIITDSVSTDRPGFEIF